MTYAWWHAPELIKNALREELDDAGFSLVEFSMKRPNGWHLIINRISIASEDLIIDISGLELSPASASRFELSVHIDEARLAITGKESDQPSVLSWGTAIDAINNNTQLIPVIGKIRYLKLCEKKCFEGEFSWWRHENIVKTRFKQSSSMITSQISPDAINFSLTGSGDFVFLLNTSILLHDQLQLSGNGWFQNGTRSVHLDGKDPVEYQVDLDSLNFEFSGNWPIDGIISDINQDLTGEIVIDAKPHWNVQLADSRFLSDQPVTVKVGIDAGIVNSTLMSALDIRMENPYLDSSLITLAPGLSCTSNISNIVNADINCVSDDIVITSHEDVYDTRVGLTKISFRFQGDDWQASADAGVNLLENSESIFRSQMEIAANNIQISATSRSAEFLGVGNVVTNIEHNFLTEKGLIITSVEQAAADFIGLAEYLDLEGFDVLGGNMSIGINLNWNLQSQAGNYDLDLKIKANALDIEVGTYQLEQGALNLHLGGWGTLENRSAATMSWQHINIGVLVENIQTVFDLSLSETELKISGKSFNAEVFGGQISSNTYSYDVMSSTGVLNLELDKLELNQILALQQEDFESSGKISGSVPVQIDKGTLSISKGNVSAIEPGGFIRYKPGQAVVNMLTGNDQLKVVVETMENFQYDTLDVELEYSPEGQLVAHTSLKGSNPAYENGREVHLNIKLEENIAALLESLRLGDELTRKIGEKNSKIR